MVVSEDPGVSSPQRIVEAYCQVFQRVHNKPPVCHYIGNQWYTVNGETVHRATLIAEIESLRDLAMRAHLNSKTNKSMVQKLIARLRGM